MQCLERIKAVSVKIADKTDEEKKDIYNKCA